jgi:hypothetical protein
VNVVGPDGFGDSGGHTEGLSLLQRATLLSLVPASAKKVTRGSAHGQSSNRSQRIAQAPNGACENLRIFPYRHPSLSPSQRVTLIL